MCLCTSVEYKINESKRKKNEKEKSKTELNTIWGEPKAKNLSRVCVCVCAYRVRYGTLWKIGVKDLEHIK